MKCPGWQCRVPGPLLLPLFDFITFHHIVFVCIVRSIRNAGAMQLDVNNRTQCLNKNQRIQAFSIILAVTTTK